MEIFQTIVGYFLCFLKTQEITQRERNLREKGTEEKTGAKHIADEMAAGKMRLIKTCFGGEDRFAKYVPYFGNEVTKTHTQLAQ